MLRTIYFQSSLDRPGDFDVIPTTVGGCIPLEGQCSKLHLLDDLFQPSPMPIGVCVADDRFQSSPRFVSIAFVSIYSRYSLIFNWYVEVQDIIL